MLDKSQGAVGCGHCRGLVARVHTCPVCGATVCEACSQARCPEPHARELRLGLGRRLRAVDEVGRLGLVSDWSRVSYRLADLEAGRWVEARCHRLAQLPQPLLAGGRMVQTGAAMDQNRFSGVRVQELWPGGHKTQIETSMTFQSPRLLRPCHETGLCVLVTDNEEAEVVDLARCQVISSVSDPGQVIHAVEASSELDLIALGSYQRLALSRLGGGTQLALLKGVLRSDLHWIGLSRSRLALQDTSGQLEVYPLDPRRGVLGPPSLTLRAETQSRLQADLSPDGRLLVVVQRRRPVVYDLEGSDAVELTGHTDDVHLVRFVRGGRLLITADEDNRVICWPRQGSTVVTRVAPAAALSKSEPTAFDDAMRVDLAPCEAVSVSG